jgi:methyltransferase
MSADLLVPIVAVVVVIVTMLGELRVSRANEAVLFRQGAIVPADPVFSTMRWAYPATFAAMAIEGAAAWTSPIAIVVAGAIVFAAAKALKYWAIASLGPRWSYRVLVLPGTPLVTGGPYRWLRHPNYVAVVAELVGFALLVGAPITGPLSLLSFGYLLRARIRAEEHALQLR